MPKKPTPPDDYTNLARRLCYQGKGVERPIFIITGPPAMGMGSSGSSFMHYLLGPAPTRRTGFPRVWELFGFILDKQTRERVFEPHYNDMLAMYLEARRFRSKWAGRWLKFSFMVRTAWMVGDCIRVALVERPVRWLRHFLPELFLLWRWWN
jgi:hypothetical protein